MIAVENLAKHFGPVTAVKRVSFKAADGRVTGLLGPNGAGKTTTLRMISTLVEPSGGSVSVDGIDARTDPIAVRRRTGVLSDSRGLYGRLTARENIAYYGDLRGIARPRIAGSIARLAALLELEPLLDRRTEGFSQGERMKVAIARALVHDPPNVVLDEPTNGLDVMTTRSLREAVRRLREAGKCVLFSSHVMQEVAALCDEIVIVSHGEVAAAGTPAAIREAAGCEDLEEAFVRLTVPAPGERCVIGRALVVFAKEVRDALRDRRTALMVFVASVITGPLTLVLVAQFVSGLEERAATLKVRIVGESHAPALVNFLQRADVEIERAPEDYAARVKDGSIDAVIVVPADFHERWLAHEDARVELVYDDSRTEAAPAIRQAERLLAAFNRETAYLRLMARGVSPSLNESVKVERVNAATPRQKGAVLLFLIPMFAILAPLLGGMTLAIDATAGERERGSLEPLLANPVSTATFAFGKWLAAWTSATVVAVVTLAGFLLAASLYAERKLPSLLQFGVPEFARFVAIVIPLAAFTSAVQMLISTYGRSYREAQTYVSYLATVVSFVPLAVMFSGARDAPWQVAVPVLGQLMALQRVLRGDGLSATDAIVPAAIALFLAVGAVSAVARLLRNERIVFGRS